MRLCACVRACVYLNGLDEVVGDVADVALHGPLELGGLGVGAVHVPLDRRDRKLARNLLLGLRSHTK